MNPQGSPEWFLERLGHATASEFKAVKAKGKSGEATTRRNYRVQLAVERLTGIPYAGYHNEAMDRGNEIEAEARAAYEEHTGRIVREVGFLKHPRIAWCGGSPDGVGEDRLVQIKCPDVTAIHVETMLAGRPPPEHIPQVQGELAVTGLGFSDFVSYDPRMPERLRLFIVTVPQDRDYIEALEAEIQKFLAEVEELADQLMKCVALNETVELT